MAEASEERHGSWSGNARDLGSAVEKLYSPSEGRYDAWRMLTRWTNQNSNQKKLLSGVAP